MRTCSVIVHMSKDMAEKFHLCFEPTVQSLQIKTAVQWIPRQERFCTKEYK